MKPLADIIEDYQNTINVMLSPQPNFVVNDGDLEEHELPNTPEMRRILKLIPLPHKNTKYVMSKSGMDVNEATQDMSGKLTKENADQFESMLRETHGSVEGRIVVTPAAKEVIDTVGQDLLKIINDAESTAASHQFQDDRFGSDFGKEELAEAERMMKELGDDA